MVTALDIKNALPGQVIPFVKAGLSPPSQAQTSFWTISPNAGVAPSSGLAGDVPTDATVGAYPFVNAQVSKALYLADAWFSAGRQGTIRIYDRLLHNSGINVTSTGAQTLNTVALTRPNSLGDNVEAWWEVYATTGAATPIVILSYTAADGTATRTATSLTIASGMLTGRTGQFSLQGSDTGVRSVQTWTNLLSFVSGTIGLVLRRHIATISVNSEGRQVHANYLTLGMPTIPNDACIEMLIETTSASTQTFLGELRIIEL